MLVLWLQVITIQYSQGDYQCGYLEIPDNVECLCGNHTITYSDEKACCGVGKCHYEPGVGGVCSEGSVCISSFTWPCGDIRIGLYRKCQCGSETLSYDKYSVVADKYYDDDNWCCGNCSYSSTTGDGSCEDGRIMKGFTSSCDAQYCGKYGLYLCSSGECVCCLSRQ